MTSIKDNLCKIISNQELSAGYFRLQIEKPFASFVPGQFCMVRVPGQVEALLRRPFSLCQENAQSFEIIYKAIGRVTRTMAALKPNQQLWVLGPLGSGVNWSSYQRVIGIAGGYGIAPMLGLGHHLKLQGISYEVYYGARSASDLLLEDDFAAAAIALHVCTEDGSKGFRGRVTELLERDVAGKGASRSAPTLWFVCGPHGLLQVAAELAKTRGFDCAVSMEEYMGCGIGVCLGCVVKTADGRYIRSCVEGPVLNSREVKWQPN